MSGHPLFLQLMADLRTGESDAARAVFDRYVQRLVTYASARLPVLARSKIDPEDVAQSVFRTFFRRHRAGEFQPENWDALWSLLALLAARKCGHQVAHLFAAKRDARREAPSTEQTRDRASDQEPIDHAPTAAEALVFEETLTHVLTGLKERERAIVFLRLQGHSIPETAEKAGASVRSVHRILARVRGKLESIAVE